jgi:hypothetical protein
VVPIICVATPIYLYLLLTACREIVGNAFAGDCGVEVGARSGSSKRTWYL